MVDGGWLVLLLLGGLYVCIVVYVGPNVPTHPNLQNRRRVYRLSLLPSILQIGHGQTSYSAEHFAYSLEAPPRLDCLQIRRSVDERSVYSASWTGVDVPTNTTIAFPPPFLFTMPMDAAATVLRSVLLKSAQLLQSGAQVHIALPACHKGNNKCTTTTTECIGCTPAPAQLEVAHSVFGSLLDVRSVSCARLPPLLLFCNH